ncbi:MAG: DUF2007 domain-containing protein [Kangiellaceae bacterium]|nr:DUF2007 domain-containing protein [Kangiellaceae bacterium]
MIRVYSNESALLVNHMKNLLESDGISSLIKNERMQGIGIGELGMCWPELWIKDTAKQADAEKIIESALSDVVEKEEWACKNCSEINEGTFKICWNCSASI